MLVRGFAAILLDGLGVEDHQNDLRHVQILLNAVYFCGVGGNSIDENPIIAQLTYNQNLKKGFFCRTQSVSKTKCCRPDG